MKDGARTHHHEAGNVDVEQVKRVNRRFKFLSKWVTADASRDIGDTLIGRKGVQAELHNEELRILKELINTIGN